MSIYGRNFDKAKCIYFFIKHVKMTFFFDKYNENWKKVRKIIKRKLIENLYIIKTI